MEDSEAELTVSETDALGADFITVELDTQPIEYVVKWAEVGSKFTISCVKKDSDDPSELCTEQLKIETDEAFFAPYEEVYPCEVTEQSVEIKMDSDEEDEEEQEVLVEAGSSQLDGEADSDQAEFEPDERQYRCSYCGKCYSHASSLYRHQQTHTGKSSGPPPAAKRALEPTHQEARYSCPHCGMSFKGSRSVPHLCLSGNTMNERIKKEVLRIPKFLFLVKTLQTLKDVKTCWLQASASHVALMSSVLDLCPDEKHLLF